MLYTNIQLEVFLEKIFKCFYNISCITDRDHLYKPFQSPIKRRLQEKLEEICPGRSEENLFKDVDRRTDDGRRVITIAHPEPSAQVS